MDYCSEFSHYKYFYIIRNIDSTLPNPTTFKEDSEKVMALSIHLLFFGTPSCVVQKTVVNINIICHFKRCATRTRCLFLTLISLQILYIIQQLWRFYLFYRVLPTQLNFIKKTYIKSSKKINQKICIRYNSTLVKKVVT